MSNQVGPYSGNENLCQRLATGGFPEAAELIEELIMALQGLFNVSDVEGVPVQQRAIAIAVLKKAEKA